MTAQPRFPETFCSNCGQAFGPGDHGFSHCDNHPGWKRDRKLARQAAARKGAETRARRRALAELTAETERLGLYADEKTARDEDRFRAAKEERLIGRTLKTA